MELVERSIRKLYLKWAGVEPEHISFLPASGSYRKYYRIAGEEQPVIAAYNEDRKENEAFFSFTNSFGNLGLPVPQLLATDPSGMYYLISDLGDQTLFNYLSGLRQNDQDFPEDLLKTYKKVIDFLPMFQIETEKYLDYSKCYPRQVFDHQSMMWDLNYFKYYFLKLAKVPFDEQRLEDDFHTLVELLQSAGADYFMYRDFQSRNIMMVNGEPWFIDYQGGRKGPLQYDIASLLYDAKASIPEYARELLSEYYLDVLETYNPVDRTLFYQYYYGFVLIRILQALGTYGFRGYYENKPHFLKSIPYAISNLQYLLEKKVIPEGLPMLKDVLEKIIANPIFRSYKSASNQLTIEISSFSYKMGIPEDKSGNGGGFVFDCRALPNPGKYEEFQSLTGNDHPVRTFLEKEYEVGEFMNHACSLVDQNIRKYIERGFTHLTVNFGCTGGQHRSVYCANELAKYILSKFDVTIDLQHTELKENHKMS
jgi:aminoglycoside/choline kinase family phosphotransferase